MRLIAPFKAEVLDYVQSSGAVYLPSLDPNTVTVENQLYKDRFVSMHLRRNSEGHLGYFIQITPLGEDALSLFDRKCDQDAEAEIQRKADALNSNHNKVHALCHDLFVALFGAFLAFTIEHPYHLIQLIQITLCWPAE